MKMTTEHYHAIKEKIKTSNNNIGYLLENYVSRDPSIPRIKDVKDIQKRFRWDMFWNSRIKVCSEMMMPTINEIMMQPHILFIQADYTNDHIDTALKKIIKELVPEHKRKLLKES